MSETSTTELDARLARAESASRRRTVLVLVLFLGAVFGSLYFTVVSVSAARGELAEAEEARRKALQRMQAAMDSLHAVNADQEQQELAHGQMHDQSVALSARQGEQEAELERLRRDRDRLLEAIEQGRGEERAVSTLLEMVEREQAAGRRGEARVLLDRVLELAPNDALAKELDGELGGARR